MKTDNLEELLNMCELKGYYNLLMQEKITKDSLKILDYESYRVFNNSFSSWGWLISNIYIKKKGKRLSWNRWEMLKLILGYSWKYPVLSL